MNAYQPFAAVSQLPAALRSFLKNHAPGFVNTHIVDLVNCHQFEPPYVFLSVQSGQMTMPARRASKLSAKICAVLLLIILQSLTC